MVVQRSHLIVAAIQKHNSKLVQVLQFIMGRRKEQIRQQIAVRVLQWISRRVNLVIYYQLMVELCNEEPRALKNFMRIPYT